MSWTKEQEAAYVSFKNGLCGFGTDKEFYEAQEDIRAEFGEQSDIARRIAAESALRWQGELLQKIVKSFNQLNDYLKKKEKDAKARADS
jgi:hypothetical protein